MMQLLITLLLAISVIYLVCREFLLQDDVKASHVPCVHQYICDYKDVAVDGYRFIAVETEEAIKTRQLEERRREYKEWVDNCNHLFEKEHDVSHDGKVCGRVIGEVA